MQLMALWLGLERPAKERVLQCVASEGFVSRVSVTRRSPLRYRFSRLLQVSVRQGGPRCVCREIDGALCWRLGYRVPLAPSRRSWSSLRGQASMMWACSVRARVVFRRITYRCGGFRSDELSVSGGKGVSRGKSTSFMGSISFLQYNQLIAPGTWACRDSNFVISFYLARKPKASELTL